MKNLFSKFWFQGLMIAILVIAFWFPIMFDNEFFYDDWAFIDTFKAGAPSIGWFLKPHNEHFMPVFKLIYFVMFKLFGLNIIPYMGLCIILHIVNSVLLLGLLNRLTKNKIMPVALTLFFALNATYYEILHWFVNLSQGLTFMAFLITLILMYDAYKKKDKQAYYLSIAASFFIPMNFSLGFLGIFFMVVYYFFILKGKFIRKELISDIKYLSPYVITWLAYFAIYLTFSLASILHAPKTAPPVTFAAGKILFYILLGFTGLYVKNMGFSMLVFPYTTGLAALLTALTLIIMIIYLMYFFLNGKKERLPMFRNNGTVVFGLIGILTCYVALAVGRASLEAEAFLGWGRYHYLPLFFLTVFKVGFIPRLIEIFTKFFNKKRLMIFFSIIFLIFLVNQFILIRQKAASPIRTEGSLPIEVTVS